MKALLTLMIVLPVFSSAQEAPSFVNEATVNATVAEVWKVWSTSDGYKSLGVAKADVDFRVDGLIRSHYAESGVLGDEGTIQNRVMAYEPQRMIAIRIDKPPKGFPFKEAWKKTWTVITMTEAPGGKTHLRVASMGFDSQEESVAMRRFFEAGNAFTLSTLVKHFDSVNGKLGLTTK